MKTKYRNFLMFKSAIVLTLFLSMSFINSAYSTTSACYATEVVDFQQGLNKLGDPVITQRSDPDAALGAPLAQDPFNYDENDFFSLGFGGFIVLKFEEPITNGPGNDIRIFEATGPVGGAAPTCAGYPEYAKIYVSQDNVNFYLLDTICLDGDVDISDAVDGMGNPVTLGWIQYVKIVDVSDPNDFPNSSRSDGFDVDAIQCLNGFSERTGCYPNEVISFNQGPAKYPANGNQVATDRSDPDKALGEPAGNNQAGEFVSLGFGGELIVKFENQIANGPGNDLRIVETSFGDPSCSQYPEFAEVFVSQDNIDYYSVGIICLTDEVDVANAVDGMGNPVILPWFQYVKIVDMSDPDDFNTSPITDGYDVDGIECLNGEYEPPALGCFADYVVSYNQGLKKNGNPVDADRSDHLSVLGSPDAQTGTSADLGNFYSLGFGGEIVVGFNQEIANGPGPDIRIWETTWGYDNCNDYPEVARVYAALDNNFNWVFLDTVCLGGDVDLGPLPYAKYIRIVDISDPDDFSQNPSGLDGFDVDAIECLNGPFSGFKVDICDALSLDVDAGNDKSTHYYGAGTSCVTLNATATAGDGNYSYEWSNGETTSSITVCPSSSTLYTVTVTDGMGCTSTDDVYVDVTDIQCGWGNKGAIVCYQPVSFLPWLQLSLCVSKNSVPFFVNNMGATLGACGSNARMSPSEVEKHIKDLPGDPVAIDNMLYAYPNPFADILTIEYLVPREGTSKLQILDINGRLVYEQSYEHSKHSLLNITEVNLSNQASGVYIVKVVTETDVFTFKVNKSK
ncbi:MAG: T9SS C-terminal target domain-containing protein [Chitinophagaceae bacterium]|nr:MAG: T9SS C-terminal target domain-containing protein [Chitinophagaceae bacterium]